MAADVLRAPAPIPAARRAGPGAVTAAALLPTPAVRRAVLALSPAPVRAARRRR